MAGQRQTASFEIQGLSQVEANLAHAIKSMTDGGHKALKVAALEVIKEAKQFAPVGKTGLLRSSLAVLSEDAKSVTVGTKVPYAHRIEYGFMDKTDSLGRLFKVPAQPFLRPAIQRVAAKLTGIMAPIVRHSIKGAA